MAVNIKKEFGNTLNRKVDTSTHLYGKIQPQAPELEEAVLGVILLEREWVDTVLLIIKTADVFYVPANQKIYQSIMQLREKGTPVDLLTVTEQLRKNNELEVVGGPFYLTGLTHSVVSGAHVDAHCRLIVEKYIQRETIRISGELLNQAYDDSTDAFDLVDFAQSSYEHLTEGITESEIKSIGTISIEAMKEVNEERYAKVLPGSAIGITSLREKMNYWRKGTVVVLAGRPGTGKTALALQFAVDAVTSDDNPTAVGILSMEMKGVELAKRLQANAGNIAIDKISNPKSMSDEEMKTYVSIQPRLQGLKVFIDDKPALNINQVRVAARKMKSKYNISFLIIDYLQLMEGLNTKLDRRVQLEQITRKLKELAKAEDITILELSQLNREIEKRPDAKPKISDLKESGSIEEDADIVMLLSRPTEKEIKDNPHMKDMVVIDVAKFRNGKPFAASVHFDKTFQRFESEKPLSFPSADNLPF